MISYLLVIIKLLFVSPTYNDALAKLTLCQNVDNAYIIQTGSTTWEARDRTYKIYNSTMDVANFFYFQLSQSSGAYIGVDAYTLTKSTYSFVPPKFDIQRF